MIMILQARNKVTAADLAEELEVSERTVYRDVTALSTAGVPVYTEKGPGGGIRLVEDYRTTLTGLSADEVQALFMLNVPESLAAIGVSKELQNALLKLTASLPVSLQEAELDVRQRVLIDEAYETGGKIKTSSHLIDLYRAVWEDRLVRIAVQYGFGVEMRQEIAPYSLVASGGKWFVVGKLGENYWGMAVQQIVELEILECGFEREKGYDLRRFWQRWKDQVLSEAHPYVVTVLVEENLAADLLRFGSTKIIENDKSWKGREGWRKMVLGFGYFFQARTWVLKLGGAVEVVSPEPLRMSVVDFSRQTLALYEQ
jgi:predicted DNA-binding transcriptional regulator YafY